MFHDALVPFAERWIITMEETKKQKSIEKLEEDKEALERRKKRVLEREDDEDMEILRTYRNLDRMREACGVNDTEILRLLDEKQSVLDSLRRRKMEFGEEFPNETKNEEQKIEETEANFQEKNAEKNEEDNN